MTRQNAPMHRTYGALYEHANGRENGHARAAPQKKSLIRASRSSDHYFNLFPKGWCSGWSGKERDGGQRQEANK